MTIWIAKREKGINRGNTYYIRRLSPLIYFTHMLVVPFSYNFVARYLPQVAALGGRSIIWSGCVAGITFTVSFVISVVVLKVVKESEVI